MKKPITILFAISLMTILLLAGCKPTPEKPVVRQKDMEQLIEKAKSGDDRQSMNSLAEQLNAPENYSTNIDGHNGDLQIQVDAKIIIPNAKGISAIRVNKHEFSQEEADKMICVLLQGESLYQIDNRLTKDEIQAKLIKYYGMRDGTIPMSLDGDNPSDKEKLNQVIKDYEALLANAPATKTLSLADIKLHTPENSINPKAKAIEGMATVNGKAAYLYINNGFFNENNIDVVFNNTDPYLSNTPQYSSYKILSEEDMKEIQTPASFTLAESDAVAMANDVLEKLGLTDMVCASAQFCVYTGESSNSVVAADANEVPEFMKHLENAKWAYNLQYQRTVNGIPITLTDSHGNAIDDDDNVSVPWPYEQLELIVDETGVIFFHYLSPYDVIDTITENSTLLDFSEITSIFAKMLPITYSYLSENGADYKINIKIDKIQLGLMRIKEQNSRDTGLLIPVWNFLGDEIVTPHEGEAYQSYQSGKKCFLAINAIDGTIIDLNKGY